MTKLHQKPTITTAELLGDYVTEIKQQWGMTDEHCSYSEWIEANTKLGSKAFSFEKYKFQRQIADDMSPDLAVLKISQVGLTEIQLRKAMAFAKRQQGTNTFYLMPDDRLFRALSQRRLLPFLQQNPNFQTAGEVRNLTSTQIGESFVISSAVTESAATSQPADFIVSDEIDLADQPTLALFDSRLRNSQWKLFHKFSTPTYTGFGIHAAYESSDKKEWLLPCDACNHYNIPRYSPEFVYLHGTDKDKYLDLTILDLNGIDPSKSFLKCEKCHSPLNPDHPRRMWVAQCPGVFRSGYYVRPFCNSVAGVADILVSHRRYLEAGDIKGFCNTVIGEPFTDETVRIDADQVRKCFTTNRTLEPSKREYCAIGIDVGKLCHVVIGLMTVTKSIHFVLFEAVPLPFLLTRVMELDKKYNIIAGGIDRAPETTLSQAISEATDHRIMPFQYRTHSGAAITATKDETGTWDYFVIDRTTSLDSVLTAVRAGKVLMSGYGHQEETIVTHFRNVIRVEVEPKSPAIYNKLHPADHFLHACGYVSTAFRSEQYIRNATPVPRTTVGTAKATLPSYGSLIGSNF